MVDDFDFRNTYVLEHTVVIFRCIEVELCCNERAHFEFFLSLCIKESRCEAVGKLPSKLLQLNVTAVWGDSFWLVYGRISPSPVILKMLFIILFCYSSGNSAIGLFYVLQSYLASAADAIFEQSVVP